MSEDNWIHRSQNMRCRTCMFFVEKQRLPSTLNLAETPYDETLPETIPIGRCRKNAPTMSGFPVVFSQDWCGQHKLNENKV